MEASLAEVRHHCRWRKNWFHWAIKDFMLSSEEMKISLLKGYLFSHTWQNITACKNIGRCWKTDSWPNHIPLSAVRSSKPQLHMPQHTHTHTHTRLLHADTCKNICPNTKIGLERLHLHLCPGPHLHTGVRMWHIHTDRERKIEEREGEKRERGESHYCGRPKSFF